VRAAAPEGGALGKQVWPGKQWCKLFTQSDTPRVVADGRQGTCALQVSCPSC